MESKVLGKYVGVFKSGKMKGLPRWAIMVRIGDGTEKWIDTDDEEIGGSIISVEKGDLIQFEYQQSGTFFKLTEPIVKIVDVSVQRPAPGSEPPEEKEEYDPEDDPNRKIENKHYFCPKKNRLISRQSSLERAVEFFDKNQICENKDEYIHAILELAEIFYQWVNRA